jgi:hypothetical protein
MLALFCLRLAAGLLSSLLLLSPAQINPRFYRTHFLIALGLTVAASLLLWEPARIGLTLLLGLSVLAAFLGSLAWSLQGAPGGRILIVIAGVLLAVTLVLVEWPADSSAEGRAALVWLLAGDFTSAALLGTATTAMLMGHSYLIAPAISLTPLYRLLAALAVAILLRGAVSGIGLWFWTRDHSFVNLKEVTLYWLPLRWSMSFVGPLVLGWMAWRAARIRSTQSATGILYVVVSFCFLGELTGQLLLSETGFTL